MDPKQARRRRLKKNLHVISRLYNGVHTVYGPYDNSDDGRYRVVLYDGQRRITRQYSKLKMEIKLGRRLGPDETVAHKDDNFHNDRYSNLEVIGRSDHIKLDAVRVKRGKVVKCIQCHKEFRSRLFQLGNTGKAGPFCGKVCIGKYARHIQMGGSKIKREIVNKEYYKQSGNVV